MRLLNPDRPVPWALMLITLASLLGARTTTAVTAGTTHPSILGQFSGSGSVTNSGCQDPADDGPDSFSWTLTIANQQDGNFTGSGNVIDQFGTSALSVTGSIDVEGFVSASFDVNDGSTQSSGSLSGSLSGDTLSLSVSGSDIVGDTCSFSGSMSGSRPSSGSTPIDPDQTASGATTGGQVSLTSSQVLATRIAGRALNVLHMRGPSGQRVTGVREIPNGLQLETGTGLSAGDGYAYPIGVWASYTRSDIENNFSRTKFRMDRDGFLAGVDLEVADGVIFGLAIGYENADVDTDFNGGSQDVDGYTVAPYFGWLFGDLAGFDLTFDLTAGYTKVDINQDRTAGGIKITSDLDADRWFWAGNFTASRAFDDWYVSARFGLLGTKETQENYTESNGTFNPERDASQRQWSLGGEAAYSWGDFEPYLNVAYERDFRVRTVQIVTAPGQSSPSNDDDDVRGALGIRYFNRNGISGSLEWNRVFGRSQLDEDNFSLLIRADF